MIKDGIINLNKPKGMTSQRCVQAIRKLTGIKRVGHTGTLDPQTTGVLPIGIGSATRVMEYLELDFKKYRASFVLGLSTDTQDIWGNVLNDSRESLRGGGNGSLAGFSVSRERIEEIFQSYSGLIRQTPPKYSALRVGGRRLYDYARAGEAVEIKERNVFIKDISIVEIDWENYTGSFDVTCSKGTYVRTICSDIGDELGVGGAMSGLIRLASGVFKIEDAVSLEALSEMSKDEINDHIKIADYPLIHFGKAVIESEDRASWFVNGGHIALGETAIETEPVYASKEHEIITREEYKKAYNVYFRKDGADLFLGVAFYSEKYGKLTADKIFSRRITHEVV